MSDSPIRKTVLTLGAALAAVPAAQAAAFNVSNLNDNGAGSLRQAIEDANAAVGADMIQFQAGLTGTITLTTGQLSLYDSVDIQGPGADVLAVSGNDASRVFYLYNSKETLDVTISGLTVTGGSASNGAGIINFGENLVLDEVAVTDNHATSDGGGLWSDNPSTSVTIRDSTFSGNTADSDGGGIYFYQVGAPVLIENSTISGNQAAEGDGGGVYLYNLYGSFLIRNTTIAGNSASIEGGGMFSLTGPVGLDNSIVGDNTAATNNDLGTDDSGSFSLADSLVESPGTASIGDGGGNIFNQDPQLGALADNGGPTETHLPAATSPVIDAGAPAFVPPPVTDQRGSARVANGRIDMGSVEIAAAVTTPGTIQLTFSAASIGEAAGTVTITATRTGGSDGAVSVTVNTANGTAVAPGDYASVIGALLTWADGDTAPKSLNVTIVNDTLDEPDEAFDVVLSSPTGGATLGSPANAIITILDDDVPAQVAEVPTVGDVGLVFLTALMGMAGLYLLRRP
jgi:hypothetical protein